MIRLFRKIFGRRRPPRCYRCNGDAKTTYQALHYCTMCAMVVEQMSWLIPLGAPFGFPGSPGYRFDGPPDLPVKEEADGRG